MHLVFDTFVLNKLELKTWWHGRWCDMYRR